MVVAGAGRLRAYETLWKEAKNGKQTQRWAEIPCVVSDDQTDWGVWGRRLAENKLRTFNWIAECQSLARMKGEGEKYRELSEVFGYEELALQQMVMVGRIPGLEKLPRRKFFWTEVRDYLLPLRIPLDGPREYDYSEVTTAIEKLVSGDLTKEDLPSYSAERRLAIQQGQQDARLKQIAEQQVAGLGGVVRSVNHQSRLRQYLPFQSRPRESRVVPASGVC